MPVKTRREFEPFLIGRRQLRRRSSPHVRPQDGERGPRCRGRAPAGLPAVGFAAPSETGRSIGGSRVHVVAAPQRQRRRAFPDWSRSISRQLVQGCNDGQLEVLNSAEQIFGVNDRVGVVRS